MRAFVVMLVIGIFAFSTLWAGVVLLRSPETVVQETPTTTPLLHDIRVGETIVHVELAQTPAERGKGLSRRSSLPENQGMLFIFPVAGMHVFWMKDTLIPLDLLWIRDGKIVGIVAPMLPELGAADQDLRRYAAPEAVTHVLEINAGWVNAHGVEVGDTVERVNI